jgi:hypothetical protein
VLVVSRDNIEWCTRCMSGGTTTQRSTRSSPRGMRTGHETMTIGTAVDFLEQLLSEGPMDQTEAARLGAEVGFTEKSLRTARENLGVKPTKEGFGADGKWVWKLPGGAAGLKLIVDNDANKQTRPDDKHRAGSAGGGGDNQAAKPAHDAGTATEPEKLEVGSDNPDGGSAA